MLIKLNTEKIQGKDMALSSFGRVLVLFILFYLYLYGRHAVFDKARLFQDFHDLAACSAIILSALVVVCLCFIMNYTFKVVQILFKNAQDLSKIASVLLLMLIPIGEFSFLFNLKGIKNAKVFSYWQDKISDAFFDSSYLWHHAYNYDYANRYVIKELCEQIGDEPGFQSSFNADNGAVLVNCEDQSASYLVGISDEMSVCLFRNPEGIKSFEDLPEGWSIHRPLKNQIAVCKLDFTEKDSVRQIKKLIIAAIKDMEEFLKNECV